MSTLQGVGIDDSKTADNVRRFLSNDFIQYMNRGALHATDLSSPKLDITGVKAQNNGNSGEKSIMTIFDYQRKCGAIYHCIMDCTDNENLEVYNKSILVYKYLKYWRDSDIQLKLGLSDTPYKRRKKSALIEFADRLPVWAARYDTKLPELRLDEYGVRIDLL